MKNTLQFYFRRSLLGYLWDEFKVRYRFKFVLPCITEITLEGLKLDVSALSLKVRNRMLNGLYEAQEKRMCREFLDSSDSVLELGGAIGFIGLICQKHVGIKRYVVCEANPRTAEMLRRNYERNGLEPDLLNVALAPADGTVDLDVSGDFWDNTIINRPDDGKGRKTMSVAAMTFSSLLRRLPQKVNVLIVDIEGAEQFIDFEQLPPEIDKIIIELHPGVIGQVKMYEIIAAILARGFRVAREEDGTFVFLKRPSPSASASRPSESGEMAGNGAATEKHRRPAPIDTGEAIPAGVAVGFERQDRGLAYK